MPSVPGLAEAHGVAWRAYAASQDYPVGFYTQPKGSPNVVSSSQFLADAKAGKLPALVMRIPKTAMQLLGLPALGCRGSTTTRASPT